MIDDPIFIYGPPGVGKSTLGKALAKHFQVPFIDLDQEIVKKTGKSIGEIFSSHSEEQFRLLEKQSLFDINQTRRVIVSLGGGCLLDNENRDWVSDQGKVVCLMADYDTLADRIGIGQTGRPLLDAQPEDNLRALYNIRKPHYQSFHNILQVDDLTSTDLLWQLQRVLGEFEISGMNKNYKVLIKRDGLDELAEFLLLLNLKPPYFLVMDANISFYYSTLVFKLSEILQTSMIPFTFPAGESSKSMDTIQDIWHAMLSANMDRGGTVIALGGGVTGDIAGFAAATYMRGVSWVNLPTSLLAMVDSSLGGKTGVNLQEGKNLVGAFYSPQLVLSDTCFLSTLPDEEFLNGLAEIVKHGVVGDWKLFQICKKGVEFIKENVDTLIPQAVAVKARIIVEDPYEKGRREALNFGHTIGHAIEMLTQYQIGHGSAVSMGMVLESWLAEQLGIAEKGLADEISSVLACLGLPVTIPAQFTSSEIFNALQKDKKKRQIKIYFALPKRIGQVQAKVHISELENLITMKLEKR